MTDVDLFAPWSQEGFNTKHFGHLFVSLSKEINGTWLQTMAINLY